MTTPFKNYVVSFFVLGALVMALWGCSGSSSSDNSGITCDANGVCYNSQGVPISGTGVTGVVLQSNGDLTIAPGMETQWDTFLRGSQACDSEINSCSGLNGPPGLTINVIDTTFSSPAGFSPGSVTVLVDGGQLSYAGLNFRETGTGFAAGIQTLPYIAIDPNNDQPGQLYFIYVTGAPTAATQTVEITSNGQTIASGTMVRIQ
jgi:hypothetical protein